MIENYAQVLGFGEYIEEVYAAYEHHKLETLVHIPVTLFSFQVVDMFSANRPLFFQFNIQQDSPKAGKWSTGAEMTEEEALAEQQRMFAEARARMNGTNFGKQSESDGN